jgi:hypothetical protein
VRQRLEAKESKLAEQLAAGGMPDIPWSVGGKLRIRGFVGAFASAGSFALGLLLASADDPDWGALAFVMFVFLFIALICTMMALVNDLRTPSAGARTTPVAGLAAFLQSVRLKRYAYAYSCLLDGDKDSLARERKAVPELNVSSSRYDFSRLDGFTGYWQGLLSSGGGYTRYSSVGGLAEVTRKGDFALVRARVKVQGYPSAAIAAILLGFLPFLIIILVLTKRRTFDVTKLLRQVEGQWYVVNGELTSPEDHSLPLALEVSQQS